uniref:Phage head morphogenesis domain-containing protein n=1 Tax=Bacillus phage 41C TaxID=1943564 RepID=A0A1Q1PVS4_9CAUD|nr:hypothetical protein [Bacillus phage 41C]
MPEPQNQEELDKYLDNIITQAEKRLDKVFASRLKEIKAMINKLFEKYSKNGELTYADVVKYNRLEKEMDVIKQNISADYKTVLKVLNELLETQYVDNYLRSAYIYEMYTGRNLGFSAPSADVVQRAVENPIPLLTLPKVLERQRVELINNIAMAIAQGLMAGEGYSQVAQRVHKRMQLSLAKARLTARTEGHRVQVAGRMASAEQAAKKVNMQKMWSAALDTRTRAGHRKLDGKIINMDENFKSIYGGVGKAPGHMHMAKDDCNCRCALIYVIDGEIPSVRRARLSDGSTRVIKYIPYTEWEKQKKAS